MLLSGLSYFSTMFRSYLLLIALVLICSGKATAQADTSHLRMSLLTCGSGPEAWETFGHSAIRVTDSVAGTDNVYNYGTFNGYDDDFLMKFTRGKLLYYVSYYPYHEFLREYEEAGRSVQEQELILGGKGKQAIYEFLQWNALEENRYYKYDFFFDNCATRIRDVFPMALGNDFHFGTALPAGKRLTYRDIINVYFYRVQWQRFGVNLLLGSRIDSVMTNQGIMFLPDFLREGIRTATYRGHKVSGDPVTVVSAPPPAGAGINTALLAMAAICLLTILGGAVPSLQPLGKVMSFIVLFLTGFIGCFILVMWFGTDHQACQNNFNLLWALPTNLLLAFGRKRNKDKYALIGIVLIVISLLLHLLHIQQLLLPEMLPLLLALLFVYGMIYRKAKTKMY
jgi:hypothetical protein